MNRCPITYEKCGAAKYSRKGLGKLARNLKTLKDLPYSAAEQIKEAAVRADKMSIQGVQPKLCANLSPKRESFVIVDKGGRYILKPQLFTYSEVPENEALTMSLASTIGLDVPLHGLVYSKDGTMTYFIRRFDRFGHGKKVPVEDFAQLSGKNRETKYSSSMEQVGRIIENYCTFPMVEKVKLFRLTLFNFLVGNEDNHLKNHSLIRREPKVELAPVYDLVNTSIIMGSKEEIALSLNGKKRKLTLKDLVEYFGRQRLGITEKVISQTISEFQDIKSTWIRLIDVSFLSPEMKQQYGRLLCSRFKRLDLN